MATTEYIDVTDDTSGEQNSSSQDNARKSNDPALSGANEHHHGHLHHTAHAEQGRDSPQYTKGTTYDKPNIPSGDLHIQALHRRSSPTDMKAPANIADAEKADLNNDPSDKDPRTHTLSNFYFKFRPIFHLFIWLLFTG